VVRSHPNGSVINSSLAQRFVTRIDESTRSTVNGPFRHPSRSYSWSAASYRPHHLLRSPIQRPDPDLPSGHRNNL